MKRVVLYTTWLCFLLLLRATSSTRGAQLSAEGNTGDIPSSIAAFEINDENAQLFFERRVNYHETAVYATMPLHSAAVRGDARGVKLLLEQGTDIEARDSNGLTALHCAATTPEEGIKDASARAETAKVLLEAGANTEAKTIYGNTPLHLAAAAGCVEVVQVLLDYGASKKARNDGGNIPLDVLCFFSVAHCSDYQMATLRSLLNPGAEN